MTERLQYILNKGLEYARAQPLSQNAKTRREPYCLTRKQQQTEQQRVMSLLERKLKEK